MEPFTKLTSRVAPLLVDNIDTDQIIPARFMKGTDKLGMGEHLFADWRYRPDGSPDPGFVLNRPEYQGARILLASDNFACGSSREHAPWALTGYGFKVVIAASFADIFRSNALKNGLLPLAVEQRVHEELAEILSELPLAEATVDLAAQTILLPNGETVSFSIDGFSKACLLQGTDELGYLLNFESQIRAYEQNAGIAAQGR